MQSLAPCLFAKALLASFILFHSTINFYFPAIQIHFPCFCKLSLNFTEIKHFFEHGTEAKKPTVKERVAAAREHFELSLKWKEERYAIMETRKHYTNYFRGLSHFKPYRTRLVTIDDPKEVLATLDEIEKEYLAKYGNEQELGDLNNLQFGRTSERQIG